VILLSAFALLTASCDEPAEGIVEITISGTLDDVGSATVTSSDAGSFRELLRLFATLGRDERVSAVMVRFGLVSAGPARLSELRDAMLRLRESGRTVHCHLESADSFTYWAAASACERVTLSPAGILEMTGVATESYYLRDLLESVGIEADVLQVGEYKGAAEFLTRNDMSAATRETLEAILDTFSSQLVTGIAEARGLDAATVADLIDEAPISPRRAAEVGLVDAVSYGDEAMTHLEGLLPGEPEVNRHYVRDWREGSRPSLLQVLAGDSDGPRPTGPRVAVLYLGGAIVGGGGGSLFGRQISLPTTRRALEEIREDEEIRALVVRIDSPGGSATASDEIWREIMRIRETRAVVISMGDVAASGGYYIAAAGTEILAEPATLTGSIGVVGGKLVISDLAEDLGAHPVVLRRGRNAGLSALSQPFSPSQREALRRTMVAVHDRFVECIVTGRVMDEGRVRELATGRVWTGEQALELGLVDAIGGLHEAIVLARELSDLELDAPVEAFPRPQSLVEQLEEVFSPQATLARALEATGGRPGPGVMVTRALDVATLMQDEPVLTLWPFWIDLR